VNRLLVDTNVFLYARGRQHDYRRPCRAVLMSAAEGVIDLEASVELVQEFTHVLVRRGIHHSAAVVEAGEVRAQCLLHAFDEHILGLALTLVRRSELGVRDAVHAATALSSGIEAVISTDAAFDRIEGIRRIDPLAPDAPWRGFEA
jgi:uncharacterized protein